MTTAINASKLNKLAEWLSLKTLVLNHDCSLKCIVYTINKNVSFIKHMQKFRHSKINWNAQWFHMQIICMHMSRKYYRYSQLTKLTYLPQKTHIQVIVNLWRWLTLLANYYNFSIYTIQSETDMILCHIMICFRQALHKICAIFLKHTSSGQGDGSVGKTFTMQTRERRFDSSAPL